MSIRRNILISVFGFILVVVIAAALFWHQSPPGKRAFINGQLLTMDAQSSIVEAIIIDDGKIHACLIGLTHTFRVKGMEALPVGR